MFGLVLIQYLEDVMDNQICWFRKNKWAHFPFKSIGYGVLLVYKYITITVETRLRIH